MPILWKVASYYVKGECLSQDCKESGQAFRHRLPWLPPGQELGEGRSGLSWSQPSGLPQPPQS